jgi:starvation-inducible DNA-binding protein
MNAVLDLIDTPSLNLFALRRRQQAGAAAITTEARYLISMAANALLGDIVDLYLKTKIFHWHMNDRDYNLLLGEQGDQICAIIDPLAEGVRRMGGTAPRFIGDGARQQRTLDSDRKPVGPNAMLAILREDNIQVLGKMRELRTGCEVHHDAATASTLEVWINETEKRVWILFEATHSSAASNE